MTTAGLTPGLQCHQNSNLEEGGGCLSEISPKCLDTKFSVQFELSFGVD
jgi:hypothetical protein